MGFSFNRSGQASEVLPVQQQVLTAEAVMQKVELPSTPPATTDVAGIKRAILEHWGNVPMLVELGKGCKRAMLTISALSSIEIKSAHDEHKRLIAESKAKIAPYEECFWEIQSRLATIDAVEANGAVPVAPEKVGFAVTDWREFLTHVLKAEDWELVSLADKVLKARHKKLGAALAIPGVKIGE